MTRKRNPSVTKAIRSAQAMGLKVTGIVYLADGTLRIEIDNPKGSGPDEFELAREKNRRQQARRLRNEASNP